MGCFAAAAAKDGSTPHSLFVPPKRERAVDGTREKGGLSAECSATPGIHGSLNIAKCQACRKGSPPALEEPLGVPGGFGTPRRLLGTFGRSKVPRGPGRYPPTVPPLGETENGGHCPWPPQDAETYSSSSISSTRSVRSNSRSSPQAGHFMLPLARTSSSMMISSSQVGQIS